MKVSRIENKYADLLRKAGFKATQSKVQLLSILAKSKKPLSVDGIYSEFVESAADIATVYRSIKEFLAAGLIKQINFQHGHGHYEFAGLEDHHHFICSQCGKVEDIDNCDLDSIIKKAVKNSANFKQVTGHSFELFGLCGKCTL